MDAPKPKKALRHLFTRTEPESADVQTNEAQTLSFKDASPETTTNNLVPKEESIKLDAIEQARVEIPTAKTLNEVTTTHEFNLHNDTQENRAPKVEQKIESGLRENKHFTRLDAVISNSTAPKTEEKNKDLNPNPYSFVKIQYNIDQFKVERASWKENDYISFITKIDQAQTDAFFLKGKLISEIKDKFYLNNKKGWAIFCDETLNMNYTTANQYIRVSQEFDVTSHQRMDFGFEHFKTLLPLPQSERNEVISCSPENVSVKRLREMVSKKLQTSPLSNQPHRNIVSTKNIVETLHKLKDQLEKIKSSQLTQEEKWQLYGAFQNISYDMKSISNAFMPIQDPKNELSV